MLEKLLPKDALATAYRKGGWLAVIGAVVGLAALAYCEQRTVETVVHDAVTGCSENAESQSARAARVFAAVVERWGKPVREARGGDELFFREPRFELSLDDSPSDPCHWVVHAIAHAGEHGGEPAKLQALLDDPKIGRRYERSGIWIARQDGSLWLMKTQSLRQLQPSSLFWLEDHLAVAEAWSGGWLDEVREIGAGRRPPPPETVYRPGKDPKAVLEGVERFLRDAGVPP